MVEAVVELCADYHASTAHLGDLVSAMQRRSIHLEVEGTQIEAGLETISAIDHVKPTGMVGDHKTYSISVLADADPRADIFKLANGRGWVLWELHQEQPRLEDVFHMLTIDSQTQGKSNE